MTSRSLDLCKFSYTAQQTVTSTTSTTAGVLEQYNLTYVNLKTWMFILKVMGTANQNRQLPYH